MEKLQQDGDDQSHWYDLLQACFARVMLDTGRLDAANTWVQQSNISKDEDAAIHQSYEIATLIRILIARRDYDDALNWAERMRGAASRKGLTMTLLESHLLMAVIHDGLNQAYESMIHLHQALAIGEEEGYVRTLISLHEMSFYLLEKYVIMRKKNYIPDIQQGVSMTYVHRLLVLTQPAYSEQEAETREGIVHKCASEYEL